MHDMFDLFTLEELRAAKGKDFDHIFNVIVTEEVMERIAKATGQSNDRRYMSYRLEYLANKHG